MASLFIKLEVWEPTKCPSTLYIYAVEYYVAIKKIEESLYILFVE